MTLRLQPHRARALGALAAALCAGACGGVRACASGPAAPAAHYLYVVHDPAGHHPAPGADPQIATLRIDPSTGALARVGDGPVAAQAVGAWALSIDPGGRWFALAGSQLGLLRLASSGAVERIGTPDGGGLSSAFDTQGRYFFLTTGRGLEVHGFGLRRGPDIGKPLHLEAGVMPLSLATSPDGAQLYAVAEQKLLVYAIGGQGRLTAAGGSPVALDLRGLELAVHPSGRFLLVLGEVKSDRRVAVLSVSESGAVEPVAGSPFDIGQRVRGMALSRDGARLFISDEDRHSIETFALDAAGGLHRVASTPTGPKGVGTLVVDGSDRFLYAGTVSGVLAWAIEASGELTPVPGSPFALDGRPGDIVTTPRLEGPLQAAALPDASSFDAEPERVDLAHPIATDADVARILELLEDPSDQTRYTAILALHRVTDLAPALPALVKALDDQATGISMRARLMLGPWALQHPGTVDDEVLDRLVNGKNGRGMALDNASLSGLRALIARGPVASPYVARTLVHSGQLRDEALDALTSMGPAAKPAVPELTRLLRDGRASRYAAIALGAIGPDAAAAMPELYGLMQDRSPSVANAARRAIEQIRARD